MLVAPGLGGCCSRADASPAPSPAPPGTQDTKPTAEQGRELQAEKSRQEAKGRISPLKHFYYNFIIVLRGNAAVARGSSAESSAGEDAESEEQGGRRDWG